MWTCSTGFGRPAARPRQIWRPRFGGHDLQNLQNLQNIQILEISNSRDCRPDLETTIGRPAARPRPPTPPAKSATRMMPSEIRPAHPGPSRPIRVRAGPSESGPAHPSAARPVRIRLLASGSDPAEAPPPPLIALSPISRPLLSPISRPPSGANLRYLAPLRVQISDISPPFGCKYPISRPPSGANLRYLAPPSGASLRYLAPLRVQISDISPPFGPGSSPPSAGAGSSARADPADTRPGRARLFRVVPG